MSLKMFEVMSDEDVLKDCRCSRVVPGDWNSKHFENPSRLLGSSVYLVP